MTVMHESVTRSAPSGRPRRHGWDRFLLIECTVFHGLCALVLAASGRWAWTAAFLVGAIAAAVLLRRVTAWAQLTAWYVVFPLGIAWGAALVLGITDSAVSTLGVVAWPFLYLPWAVVAVRLALGKV